MVEFSQQKQFITSKLNSTKGEREMKKLTTLIIVTLATCGAAFATDITWTQDVNNLEWGVADNWNPSQVPGYGDKAILDNNYAGTYTIYLPLDSSASCGQLELPAAANCHFRINPWHPARDFTFSNGAANATISVDGFDLILGNSGSVPYTNYLLSNLDIDLGNGNDLKAVALFAGDKDITLNSGYYFEVHNAWPNFTGKLIGNGGRMQFVTATPVPNGEVIIQNGCRIAQANGLTLNQDMTLNGAWIFRYGNGDENQGDVKVIGVSPSRLYYYGNPYTFSGDVSGTYRFFVDHTDSTLNVLGSISPGTNTIGKLLLDEEDGTLNIGTGGDHVTLNSELNGSSSDLLSVTNIETVALDLANIDLELFVVGSTAYEQTNTIITCNKAPINLGSMSVNWNGGKSGTVFQVGNDIMVTDVIPEPAFLGILVLAALALKKK